MEQNQSAQLLELLKPTFGSVKELSETIGSYALELAVTPLADTSDTPAVQNALFVMVEIKKALDAVSCQPTPPNLPQE